MDCTKPCELRKRILDERNGIDRGDGINAENVALQEELIDLRAKLASAEQKLAIGKGHLKACELQINKVEAERDELMLKLAAVIEVGKKQSVDCDYEVGNLMAHNVVLRNGIEEIMRYIKRIDQPDVGFVLLYGICEQTLSTTPSDSAAKVQGLVDALEWIAYEGYVGFENKARQALAEWRKNNGKY